MDILWKILAEQHTLIWIDLIWIATVIIISPPLFLIVMIIEELPVACVRHIFRIINTTKNSNSNATPFHLVDS